MLLSMHHAPSLIFLFQLSLTYNQDVSDIFCCSKVSGSCRSACQQMSVAALVGNVEHREKKLKAVRHMCPRTLIGFWQCFSATVRGKRALQSHGQSSTYRGLTGDSIKGCHLHQTIDIKKTNPKIPKSQFIKKWNNVNGDAWSGRHCCPVVHSKTCQSVCITSSNRNQLGSNCRRSDELEFYSCLTRQEEGDNCCGQAKSPECFQACHAMFRYLYTPKKQEREVFLEQCNESPKVLHCTKNLTKVTYDSNAAKYLYCCDRTTNIECRDSCRHNLKTKTNLLDIFDSLQDEGCGTPTPHGELWQCFLQNDETSDNKDTAINRIGMDAAKLHCCARAVSTNCRQLCVKTFSDEWMRSWADFNDACLNSMAEEKLQTCIDEVEEPCELGCDGLNYCSNFNNRPTGLFRSCTSVADDAARYDVEQWTRDSLITLPGLAGIQLPLMNMSRCSPEKWKAVACALQIKPCHPESHGNRICKESCYEILSSCIDWSRMRPGQTVSSLCSKITSWPKGTHCISLIDFLEPSDRPLPPESHAMTVPCNHHPCDATELCVINHNCQSRKSCQVYQCLPGCRLGEASTFIVPWGTYVRIPVKSDQKGCIKICRCSESSELEECQPLPCTPTEDCWLGDKKIEHGTTFHSDCNLCACYSGEITCSKRQCVHDTRKLSTGWTSLPCNCPTQYMPVCARNGYTYPNQCLAKCAGVTEMDYEFGECSYIDPCENNPCPHDLSCVKMLRVCMSLLESPCQQFICVNHNDRCSEIVQEPVCDTEQQEHANLCYMLRAGQTLSHRGSCKTDCQSSGKVCGVDGFTYDSECQALADYSAVDYYGPCQEVGAITTLAKPMCSNVDCPPLPRGGCQAVTPPGACCPTCAGALRILYSRKQVDKALYALQGATVDLTIRGVLAALQRQVKVTECRLWGYLTIEMDIFVAVSAPNGASLLQQEVCVHEAQKLAHHIERGSPRYLSELALSVLITATPIHTHSQSSAILLRISYTLPFCLLLLTILY